MEVQRFNKNLILMAVMMLATFFACASAISGPTSAAVKEAKDFRSVYQKTVSSLVGRQFTSDQTIDNKNYADDVKRQTSSCWPGFPATPNKDLRTCCWYGAESCCTPTFAEQILPVVEQQLDAVYKNGTKDKCYLAIADLLCLWCHPNTASFIEGSSRHLTLVICPSMCVKLWDACKDQQATFGITTPALTPRQFCAQLLIEEEGKENDQQGVSVVIAGDKATECYGGAPSLATVENGDCLAHYSRSLTATIVSNGAVVAMVLVPIILILLTAAGVTAYFVYQKKKERYEADRGFSIPSDAFGDTTGFLDDDIENEALGGKLEEEEEKFSVQ